MPRPLSYRDRSEDLARAGAVTLSRMEDDAVNERRYQEQLARQTKQDERAESREQRIDDSVTLENEVRKYDFEKKKSFDANAARMRIEYDKEATEGNSALVKIKTDAPDAPLKLAEWEEKYFRVLDDPRLAKQLQINRTRVETYRTAREKAEAERAKVAEEQANVERSRQEVIDKGLIESGATVGADGKLRTTYTAPEKPKAEKAGSYEDFNKELKAAVESYGGQENVPAEVWASFEERKKKLAGASPSPATAAPGGEDPQKSAALRWAEANPSDPRSAAIKKKLGL